MRQEAGDSGRGQRQEATAGGRGSGVKKSAGSPSGRINDERTSSMSLQNAVMASCGDAVTADRWFAAFSDAAEMASRPVYAKSSSAHRAGRVVLAPAQRASGSMPRVWVGSGRFGLIGAGL